MTHDHGERADCYRQYLAPVLGRSNLTVLTDAKTLRVETEGSGAATVTRGVTFQVNGPDGSKHAGAPPGATQGCSWPPLRHPLGAAPQQARHPQRTLAPAASVGEAGVQEDGCGDGRGGAATQRALARLLDALWLRCSVQPPA